VGKGICGLRLIAKRHQQVLIAEAIKHDHIRDRSREQLHRDGISLQTLDVLSQIFVIDTDVSGFSRNPSVFQSDPAACYRVDPRIVARLDTCFDGPA
jgi:hypothetical protein